jgi:thymidylate kinase
MRQYDSMVDEVGLHLVDGTRSIEEQQAQVRKFVAAYLKEHEANYGPRRNG